ncbi:MAG: hypothetical protein MUC50_07005 [Myxococcota bacterium]|jgi:hypothetical protein|nr:hypothetical protein [Myxococcota bacterium]
MLLKIEKAILALFTAVFPVFIAACYGMPAGDFVDGAVKSSSGTPIPNILVRCLKRGVEQDATYTMGEDGSFVLGPFEDSPPCDELSFEDVDGEENGGSFAQKKIPFDDVEYLEVTLDPAE